jgi:hypothetical protein
VLFIAASAGHNYRFFIGGHSKFPSVEKITQTTNYFFFNLLNCFFQLVQPQLAPLKQHSYADCCEQGETGFDAALTTINLYSQHSNPILLGMSTHLLPHVALTLDAK